jgi:hypothetical protein
MSYQNTLSSDLTSRFNAGHFSGPRSAEELAAIAISECDFRPKDFDPETDRMIGGIAFINVTCGDRHDTRERYIGASPKALYILTTDYADDGDITVRVGTIPGGARSPDEGRTLFNFVLSSIPEGRELLELFDRVPDAAGILRAEVTRLQRLNESAAMDTIVMHHNGILDKVVMARLDFSPEIRSLLARPAYPLKQIAISGEPIAWSMWSAAALGGKFYIFGQGISDSYLFFVSDDGVAVRMEALPDEASSIAHNLFYQPVDAEEREMLFTELRSTDHDPALSPSVEAAVERMVVLAKGMR